MAQIKVLIADPSRLFAEGLAMALWWFPEFEVLNQFAETGPEAGEAIIQTKADVALLDYFLPEVQAPGVVHRVVQEQGKTKVLVLSLFPSRLQISSCLDAGAVGFLPKSLPVSSVVEAIKRARAGESPVFAAELENLVSTLDEREEQNLQMKQRMASLTPRELRLLQMLSEGLSNADIARRLKISPATVKRHFYNIITKTEARTKEEALAMATAAGVIRR